MSEVQQNGNPSEEYSDVSENMRHYGNLRFAQLTLFMTATAAAIAALTTLNPPLVGWRQVAVALVGLVVSLVFSIIEERSTDMWHHYRRRAEKLEQVLGFKQYSTRKGARFISATNAVRLLHWGSAAAWAVVAALLLLVPRVFAASGGS
jgi:hypothetical protein